MLVGDVIRRNARRYPDRVALVFEGRGLTFAELHRRTNALARALLERARPGDRVAFLGHNSHWAWEAYVGAAKAGMVHVPLNNRFVARELRAVLERAEARVLIVDEEFRQLAEQARPACLEHVIGLQEYERLLRTVPDGELETQRDERDLVCLIHTSGTTGPPKEAMWTHRNWLAGCLDFVLRFRLDADDVVLQVTPYYHIAFAWLTLSALYLGGRVVVLRRPEVARILEAIESQGVTRALLVPTLIVRLLGFEGRERYDLRTLNTVFYGAAPMPTQTLREALEAFGPVFVQLYGFTEQAGAVTCLDREEHQPDSPRIASCGREMPGNDVRVVDERGQEVRPGQVGEIVVRGDNLMAGYWREPEQTAEAFRGGWFHSGDLATVDEEGYIYIKDRKKEVIISGGENVYPREVEEVLCAHPAVREAAVIGVPDPEWGERVRAIVVPREGRQVSAEELMEHCRRHLAGFKRPRSIVFVKELPYISIGKVDRRALRDRYGR